MMTSTPGDPYGGLSDRNPFRDLGSPDPQDRGRAGDKAPNHALWLLYLFFMPRRFFRHFVIEHNIALTVTCAWLYGIVSASSRADSKLSPVYGPGLGPNPFASSWGAYWGIVGFASLVGLLLYFYVGGWWYRRRLKWSGVKAPDKALARRVYLYAAMVIVVPFFSVKLWEFATFSTPMEAALHTNPWKALVLGTAPLWSVVTSYIGVRTVFGARGVGGFVWFLLLPSLVYGVGFLLTVFTLAVAMTTGAGGIFTPAAPDLSNTNRFESDVFSFEYPGNWYVVSDHPEHNENYFVMVAPNPEAESGAWLLVESYPTEKSPEREAMETVALLAEHLEGICRNREAPSISVTGVPLVYMRQSAVVERSSDPNYFVRSDVTMSGKTTVANIQLVCDVNQVQVLMSGFELIFESLEFDSEAAAWHLSGSKDQPAQAGGAHDE